MTEAFKQGFMSKLADFKGLKRVPYTKVPFWHRFIPFYKTQDERTRDSEVAFNNAVDRKNDKYVAEHPEFYKEIADKYLSDVDLSDAIKQRVVKNYLNESNYYKNPLSGEVVGYWRNPSSYIADDGTVGEPTNLHNNHYVYHKTPTYGASITSFTVPVGDDMLAESKEDIDGMQRTEKAIADVKKREDAIASSKNNNDSEGTL